MVVCQVQKQSIRLFQKINNEWYFRRYQRIKIERRYRELEASAFYGERAASI